MNPKDQSELLDILKRLHSSRPGTPEYQRAHAEALMIVKKFAQHVQQQKPETNTQLTSIMRQVAEHPDDCSDRQNGCKVCEAKKKMNQIQEELLILIQTGSPPKGGILEQAKKQFDSVSTGNSK